MNISTTETNGRARRKLAMDRRAAFLLAIAGVASVAGQASAEQPATETDASQKPGSSTRVAPVSQVQNLKAVGSEHQVVAVRHRDNNFEIATADGRSEVIPSINLRIKIDASDNGPPAGKPVILLGGMMGDRATLFFASPAEVGNLIQG